MIIQLIQHLSKDLLRDCYIWLHWSGLGVPEKTANSVYGAEMSQFLHWSCGSSCFYLHSHQHFLRPQLLVEHLHDLLFPIQSPEVPRLSLCLLWPVHLHTCLPFPNTGSKTAYLHTSLHFPPSSVYILAWFSQLFDRRIFCGLSAIVF